MPAHIANFGHKRNITRITLLSSIAMPALSVQLYAQPAPPMQPPPPSPSHPYIPPSTVIVPPPGGWTCDETDPTTTEASCRNNILRDKAELRRLHSLTASSETASNSPRTQQRIRHFEERVARETRALRFIQLHPDRFSHAQSPQRHAADHYILTPELGSEPTKKQFAWAGDEAQEAWTGSSGSEQVTAILGTLTVPDISIPTANGGNGSCNGKASYIYSNGWWFGIGGDSRVVTNNGYDNALFQAGVVATIFCTQGSTLPSAPLYQVFTQIPSVDANPNVVGTVSAGAIITFLVSAGYDPVSGEPQMQYVMSGSFNYSGLENDSNPNDTLPVNTVESISERNFPSGFVPTPTVPGYANPVMVGTNGNLFSSTTYSATWNNGPYSGNMSQININDSYGRNSDCQNDTNLCTRPFLSTTNSNACDALQGVNSGDMSGGANYVFQNDPKKAQNYFCLTNYVNG